VMDGFQGLLKHWMKQGRLKGRKTADGTEIEIEDFRSLLLDDMADEQGQTAADEFNDVVAEWRESESVVNWVVN
jgi:hypothetical protein